MQYSIGSVSTVIHDVYGGLHEIEIQQKNAPKRLVSALGEWKG